MKKIKNIFFHVLVFLLKFSIFELLDRTEDIHLQSPDFAHVILVPVHKFSALDVNAPTIFGFFDTVHPTVDCGNSHALFPGLKKNESFVLKS